jgi:ribosomal protein S18 acetylase RimI-like enzyme
MTASASLEITIRTLETADLPAVGRLGGALVRYHRALDPLRFMAIDDVDAGYGAFLGREAKNPKAVVLCADRGGAIVGYAYGTIEGRDWNALLDPHGVLQDLFVAEDARRAGLASRLVLEMCRRLERLGAPRVLLHTASQNREGQALFAKLGFRSTMIEMTREAGG